jgi:predicted XRE-type DNA-binding protein
MRKKSKLTLLNVGGYVKEWNAEFQVLRIKIELIDVLQKHCERNKISQRKLASMVPGLTQDRVSKIFSGKKEHMTIDKLVEILGVLQFSVTVKIKAPLEK